MPDIFVDTDNSNVQSKLFKGLKAGKSAAKAEEKMQNAVKRVVDKAIGFTTSVDGKGYAIKLSVGTVEITGNKTKCSLSGILVRYPQEVSANGEKGEVLASGMMTGRATADGTSEAALLDCVDSIAEDLAAKTVPAMRMDFARR